MYIFQKACHDDCPPFTSKYDNGFIKYCAYRPLQDLKCTHSMCSPKYPFCFDGNCLLSCPEYTVSYNGSCLMECPKEFPFITSTCDGVCYYGEKACLKSCPSSRSYIFRSSHLQQCLLDCPTCTAINGRFCDLTCPDDRPFLFNRSCFEKCPPSDPFITVSISDFNKIFACTRACPFETALYENVCVSVCPNGTILDESLQRRCVEKYGNMRPYINISLWKKRSIYFQQCMTNCPYGKYSIAEDTSTKCVTDCPLNFYLLNNTCLNECPRSFPLKYTKVLHGRKETICVQNCPDETFIHNNTCHVHCPKSLVHYASVCRPECTHPLPFMLQFNRSCTAECPSGLLRHNFSCVEKCPEEAFYVENQTCVASCANHASLSQVTDFGNKCINSETCIYDTLLMKDSKSCVSVCPRGTHIIVKNTCVDISECDDMYLNTLQGYRCFENCPNTQYADGRTCVARCSSNKMTMERLCIYKCFVVM